MKCLRFWYLAPLVGLSIDLQAQCWLLEPEPGALTFVGQQAGAPVRGEFRTYQGKLLLSPERSFLQITVDVTSIKTGLPELDDLLIGNEFFSSSSWPDANFHSSTISEIEPFLYRAEGQLRIRNVARNTTFTFRLTEESQVQRLRGEGELLRLDYEVGLGEWRNTNWVGNQVALAGNIPLARVGQEACQDSDPDDQ